MALANIRATLPKVGGIKVWLSATKSSGIVCPIQVATLKATHGQPMERKAPFDYKNRKYGLFYQLTDKTSKRLGENSKIIVVEGTLNSKKNTLAQRLAKEFDLKYIKPVSEDDLFVESKSGLDLRTLNKYLPEKARLYDLKDFYSEFNPHNGTIGIYQIWLYRLRFMQYAEAVAHVLSTGQGVVLVRSPFGDRVFAEAMRKMKYVTASGMRFYNMVHHNTICELLPPHLTIYMDQPVSEVRKIIDEKGLPYEKKSQVLTDDYLKAIENVYKNNHLPAMRETGEVMEISCVDTDINDEHDWELIVEDLEQMTLENEDAEKTQFQDWHLSEDMLGYYRQFYTSQEQLEALFSLPAPRDAPEFFIEDADREAYESIVLRHPFEVHDARYSPELYKPWQIALKW